MLFQPSLTSLLSYCTSYIKRFYAFIFHSKNIFNPKVYSPFFTVHFLCSFVIFIFIFVLQIFWVSRLMPILATATAQTLLLLTINWQYLFFCFLFIFILHFFVSTFNASGPDDMSQFSNLSKISSFLSDKLLRMQVVKSYSLISPFKPNFVTWIQNIPNMKYIHQNLSQLNTTYCYGSHSSTSKEMKQYMDHTY